MNDTHLNPNETPVGTVFDAEMSAVILLEGVQRWDPTIEDAVNDVINKLTRADKLIVLAVINRPVVKQHPLHELCAPTLHTTPSIQQCLRW